MGKVELSHLPGQSWSILSFVVKSDFHVESTRTCDVCKIDVRSLEASETSTLPNILTLAQGGQTSRLRKRRILEVDQENLCADDGCEKTIGEGDLLRCDAPGCGLTVSYILHCYNLDLPHIQYHLTCQGLFEKPSGGWFCDDECRKNAGWQVGGQKHRRRE